MIRRRAASGSRAPKIGLQLLAVATAFTLLAAACSDDSSTAGPSGTSSGGGGGSIWVLLPDTASSDRWEGDDLPLFTQAFEDAGLVNGEDFNIVNAEGDAATQQSQAEQAIADGASVIVLTSLDTGSGATIIDQAKEAGVQVIEYDRFNTGGSGGVAYVSFDNVAVGEAMADRDGAGDRRPRARPAAGRDAERRRGGQQLVPVPRRLRRDGRGARRRRRLGARRRPVRARVGQRRGPDDHGADPGRRRTTRSTRCSPPTTVSANSTINAVEAAGIGPIPISGQDATAEGIQNVALGIQTVSVYKPIQDEAGVTAAIALALRDGGSYEDAATSYQSALASGGSGVAIIGINAADGTPADSATGDGVVPYVALVPIGVTIDNIMDTVIADGFRTIDEICTGDVAQTDFCQANA